MFTLLDITRVGPNEVDTSFRVPVGPVWLITLQSLGIAFGAANDSTSSGAVSTLFRQCVKGFVLGTAALTAVFICTGALLTAKLVPTIAAAALVASFSIVPVFLHAQPNRTARTLMLRCLGMSSDSETLQQYASRTASARQGRTTQEYRQKAQLHIAQMVSVATLAGAYFSAITLALDVNEPWQHWPVPVVMGAVAGKLTGLVLAMVSNLLIT